MKTKFLTVCFLVCTYAIFAQENIQIVERSFQQGKANNCASVAIIKMSIAFYGVGKVFKVKELPDKYSITLKNNSVVEISKNKLKQMKSESYFLLLDTSAVSKKVLDYAKFCYAVEIANYMQMFSVNYRRAVRDIFNGANTDNVYKYIGLPTDDIEPLCNLDSGVSDIHIFDKTPLYIFYNEAHAALASYKTFDNYEHWSNIDSFYSEHHDLSVQKDADDLIFYAYKIVK